MRPNETTLTSTQFAVPSTVRHALESDAIRVRSHVARVAEQQALFVVAAAAHVAKVPLGLVLGRARVVVVVVRLRLVSLIRLSERDRVPDLCPGRRRRRHRRETRLAERTLCLDLCPSRETRDAKDVGARIQRRSLRRMRETDGADVGLGERGRSLRRFHGAAVCGVTDKATAKLRSRIRTAMYF